MENSFTKSFDKYACEGDTIIAEIDGFTVAAIIKRDDVSYTPAERDEGFYPSLSPLDAGYVGKGVSDTQFNAMFERASAVMGKWLNDEWFYCGIVLTVSRRVSIPGRVQDYVKISDNAASVWGIECNYPDSDNLRLTETANELLQEALAHARKCLKQICAC